MQREQGEKQPESTTQEEVLRIGVPTIIIEGSLLLTSGAMLTKSRRRKDSRGE